MDLRNPPSIWSPTQLKWGFWIILGLNLILKGIFILANDIALDEPFTIFHAQQSLGDLMALFPEENNPPLHFLVLHFWIKAFGISALSVRLPSLLFSCFAAAFLYRLGHRHFSPWTGVMAALLLTLSNFQIFHAHEARTYSLMVFLTVLSLDAFLRTCSEGASWRTYLEWGLWNTLLIYSHYLGFWLIFAQFAGLLLLKRPWGNIKKSVLTHIGVAIAYLPFLFILYNRLDNMSKTGTWVPVPHWTEFYGNVNRFLNGPLGTLGFAGLLGLGIVLVGSWGRWKTWVGTLKQDRKLWIVGLSFVVTYGGMFAVSFVIASQFLDRYLLFTTVPMFLLMARLMDLLVQALGASGPDNRGGFPFGLGLWARYGLTTGLLLLGLLIGLDLAPTNFREPAAMAEQMRSLRIAEEPIVICPPYADKTWLYHYEQAAFADYEGKADWLSENGVNPIFSFAELQEARVLKAPALLYLDGDSKFVYPNNGILEGLSEAYQEVDRYAFDSTYTLYHFRKPIP